MNRFASTLAYAGTVAAATLAASVMSGNALAEGPIEGPIIDTTPFVSTRSRADVQAEVLRARDQLSAAATEWAMQHNEQQPLMTGLSRAQVTAEYIAARDQVRAMNAEDSGSNYFAQARSRTTDSTMAGSISR